MRIFYNSDTRQQIIVTDNFACSIYLQSDETPATKTDDILEAYKADRKNVSVCQEVDMTVDMPSLPTEKGPDAEDTNRATDNGDHLTN